MVGKISPFFIVGKYSILGTPKTPIEGVGFAGVRAVSVLGQQVIFSLFALCSMANLRTNRKKNQGQFHLAKNPNQYHLTGRQSLEDRK